MGLRERLSGIIGALRSSSDLEKVKDHMEDEFEIVREDIIDNFDEFDPVEVAGIFKEMEQEYRISYVRYHLISPIKWDDTSRYIRSEEGRVWGLEQRLISHNSGGQICKDDETIVNPRTLSASLHDSSRVALSRSRMSKLGGNFGDPTNVAGIDGSVGSDTTKESAQEAGGEESGSRTVFECATGDKDCKLNRRAFVKIGEYYMTLGQDQFSVLQDKVGLAAERAGVTASDDS